MERVFGDQLKRRYVYALFCFVLSSVKNSPEIEEFTLLTIMTGHLHRGQQLCGFILRVVAVYIVLSVQGILAKNADLQKQWD
ncbi:hypothetical protein Nepgr_000349 [Nepenthes gracilis]|uniref:Uncharacterized protein n=1 Tax=Nepenthes gracilis TaxID=150966 RepID=A0AAD3P4C2_NEPGR|nr:hypothetical protein Nepgr_000349 [Nepenthes gracilis]